MKVEVYSREGCINCDIAKKLLKEKCIEFEELKLDGISITVDDLKNRILQSNSNKPAVQLPQIFLDQDDTHIGSLNDLRTFLREQNHCACNEKEA